MELRNSEGLTEKEFCEKYDQNAWPHPSYTADCVIMTEKEVLLVRRGNHPSINKLAFPGGFVEEREPSEAAAVRELREETMSEAPPLRQLVTVSTPFRDPRCWMVTTCFYAFVPKPFAVKGADDASSAGWYAFSVKYEGSTATITLVKGDERETAEVTVARDSFGTLDINASSCSGGMAFDHSKILLYAYEKMKKQ